MALKKFNSTEGFSVGATEVTVVDSNGNITTGQANIGNVGMTGAISNVGELSFFSTATVTPGATKLWWNNDEETLNIGLTATNTLQVGQETLYRVRANATITNGQPVMFVGVQGENILAEPANVSAPGFQPSYFMGVATSDITNGQTGYVTAFGKVRDITINQPAGTILWLDTGNAGSFTTTEPAAPGPKIQVAAVLKQSNDSDGIILVRPTINPRLQDISDVQTSAPSNNDYIRYTTTGNYWVSEPLDISNDTTPTLGGNLDGGGFNISNTANISGGNVTLTGNISATVEGFQIGYRNVPQVVLSSNVNVALSDSGKHFYSTTAGDLAVLIPTNANVALPVGSAFSVVVQAAGNVAVNADTGVTLYLAGNSTAGNRTVGTYGMATVMKVATDTWFINGTGVS